MQIFVQPLQRTLNVAVGTNLLEALRANDVPVSYSCLAGRCGTCRCKVIEGKVSEQGRELRPPSSLGDPYVLACQTFLTESCTIEIDEPDEVITHLAKIVKSVVIALDDQTHDIKRLRLKLAKPIEFSPGQYVQLQFGPELIRPYSMAGLSSDDTMEFHVRLVAGGRITNYIANELKIGDAVRVSGPMGSAYLRVKHSGPMVCVAGGTGLAPVLSILRGAISKGMQNRIELYFGVRSARDIYGLQSLAVLEHQHPQLRVHIVIASGQIRGHTSDNVTDHIRDHMRDHEKGQVASQVAGYRSGLVTEAIAEDFSTLDGFRAYLCGAPPMVEAASLLVRQLGVLPEQIYADAFYASGT